MYPSWVLISLVGNINNLWTKAHEQEKNPKLVYTNTVAIRYLLMFYKGLPKFINKYISLSAPFLRKDMLPMYMMTRIYWKGVLVSTNSSVKNSSVASIVPSDRGCLSLGLIICIINDNTKLLQYIPAVTSISPLCLPLQQCFKVHSPSRKVSHRRIDFGCEKRCCGQVNKIGVVCPILVLYSHYGQIYKIT